MAEQCLNSTSVFWPTDTEISRADSLYTTMIYGAICHLALGGVRGKSVDTYATINTKFFKHHTKKEMLRVVALFYYVLVTVANVGGMIEHINCSILFVPSYSLYALPYQISNALYVAMLLQITARIFTICKKTIKSGKLSVFERGLERYSFVSPLLLLISVVSTYNDPILMWNLYSYKLLFECCVIFLVLIATVYYFNQAGVVGNTRGVIRLAIFRAACSAIPLALDFYLNVLTTSGGFAPAWAYRGVDYAQLLIVARFISPSLPPMSLGGSSINNGNTTTNRTTDDAAMTTYASSFVVGPPVGAIKIDR